MKQVVLYCVEKEIREVEMLQMLKSFKLVQLSEYVFFGSFCVMKLKRQKLQLAITDDKMNIHEHINAYFHTNFPHCIQ